MKNIDKYNNDSKELMMIIIPMVVLGEKVSNSLFPLFFAKLIFWIALKLFSMLLISFKFHYANVFYTFENI